MGELQQEVEPADVGLDATRLGRLVDLVHGYVDDGRLPGTLVVLARDGKVALVDVYGHAETAPARPLELDTVFRFYSMTKPVTAVAALMLWERGAFELKDPIHRFIPSFRDTRVYRAGSSMTPITEPLRDPIAIWHLFTHTAGMTYGFMYNHPVDDLYRKAGFEWGHPSGLDLAGACDRWASLPLVFQPGTEWNYSVSIDVLGRLVEVISGKTLDVFFRDEIFEPLGMTDTGFYAGPDQADRLAALYRPDAERRAIPFPEMGQVALTKPEMLSGGGGLVGTAHDYQRFVQMLARGGELDGVRLLAPATVEYMASNHLPGDVDLTAFGRPLFAETTFDGVGFGLGVSVTIDPIKAKVPGSPGDFGWGGAASTNFWVDPVEDLTCLFLTQLLPSSTHPIRSQLKQMVHQALVD
jgi:CubicO group peptidase (beta-lactamase class C family)